jgi:hypothetical protein
MSLSDKQATELTKQANAIFTVIKNLREDARIALLLNEDDDPMPVDDDAGFGVRKVAAMSAHNLACIAVVSESLRTQATADVVRLIAKRVLQSEVERPQCLPIDQTSCHTYAISVAVKTLMRFDRRLSDAYGFCLGAGEVFDPSPLHNLESEIQTEDREFAVCVLQAVVEAIDEVGLSDEDFDTLAGVTEREGVAIASALTSDSAHDPLERLHDQMMRQDPKPTCPDIAEEFYLTRGPAERNELLQDYGSREAVVKKFVKRIEYLRRKRKEAGI